MSSIQHFLDRWLGRHDTKREAVVDEEAESVAHTQSIRRGIAAVSDSCFDEVLPDGDDDDDYAGYGGSGGGGGGGEPAEEPDDGGQLLQVGGPGADFGISALATQPPPAPVLAAYAALQAAASAAAGAKRSSSADVRWTWPERSVVVALGKLALTLDEARRTSVYSYLFKSNFVPWVAEHRAAVDAALAPFPRRSATALYQCLKDLARPSAAAYAPPPEGARVCQRARGLFVDFWTVPVTV